MMKIFQTYLDLSILLTKPRESPEFIHNQGMSSDVWATRARPLGTKGIWQRAYETFLQTDIC